MPRQILPNERLDRRSNPSEYAKPEGIYQGALEKVLDHYQPVDFTLNYYGKSV